MPVSLGTVLILLNPNGLNCLKYVLWDKVNKR